MIKILSQNVRGLGNEFKRRKTFNWLHQSQASVFLLQETHSTSSVEAQWKSEWGGKNMFFSHGESNARGVCIIFKNSINLDIHDIISDEYGRYLILDITIDNIKLLLCNIYGPNNDDPYFFELFFEHLDHFEETNKIIGGDFNLILDPSLDKRGGNPHKNKNSREMLNFIMEECNLVDIWRAQHPDTFQYTFRCMNPERIFTRLDFFLISDSMQCFVEESKIAPGYLTDHSNVQITVKTQNNEKGKGFWKFNCLLLQDPDYVALIKNVIKETVEYNIEADPGWKWETIKLAIRSKSIQFASRKKRSKDNIVAALNNRLQKLEQKMDSNPSQETEKNIKETQEDLDTFMAEKTRGAMIRSRARWVEEGERSTKYFYNLEKRNFNSKTLQCIRKNEIVINNNRNILDELKAFYQKLYKSRFNNENPCYEGLEDLNRPQLDCNEKAAMEKPIAEMEVLKALKSCQNNKSPGTDGFPAEFYKFFWSDIKPYFLDSIQYSFLNDTLSYSQKQGIITLIPKKNKDMLLIKNWRPLSLLNMDYKLIAKVIANRIKAVVQKIIHNDQTGFISGRYIGENLVKILSIIEHCEENDIPALLISIDFEKAYDCVEWSAVDYALKFFNFGDTISKWVHILYNGANSCVINNGHFSNFFNLQRGVRQGCPLSPYLFIIVAELLAIRIRNNPEIKGIEINGHMQKILQFADDTCLSVLYDPDSVNAVIQTFDSFEHFSGLKINYDKTDILRIGSLKNTDAMFYTQKHINWTNDPLLVLGIKIPQSLADLCQINFPELLVKMKNTTKLWKARNLTLYGKVLISKSLLLSQLVYKLSILPKPSAEFLKDVNTVVSKFIWNDKPARISKNILKQPLEKGGLKFVDIEDQHRGLKIAWVKRILNTQSNLMVFAQTKIPYIEDLIWRCNLHSKDIKSLFQLGSIWTDILESWCIYNYYEPNNVEDILSQVLWYNSFIRKNNLPFIEKSLFSNGIIYVRDLIDETGCLNIPESVSHAHIMSFNSVIAAVPQKWKQVLSNSGYVDFSDTAVRYKIDDVLNHQGKIPRFIYSKIIEHIPLDFKRKTKWEFDFNITINEEQWFGFFTNLYISTYHNKLRIFQYKLLQRILVTNIDRFQWGSVDDNTCSFCGTAPETYFHMLIECKYIKILWSKFLNWIARVSHIHLTPSNEEIIFGIAVQNETDKLINCLFLICKQYIYSVKCSGGFPNLNQLYKRCYKQMLVEKYIAFKNNKVREFDNKWNIIEW